MAKQVAWLTVQHAANPGERRKSDAAHFSRSKHGQLRLAQANRRRQLPARHSALLKHGV